MFRVYDNQKKVWVTDKVYLSQNGELFKIKQSIFGWTKMPLALSGDRYIYHKDIDLYDVKNSLIYEGDYILARVAEDREVVGMVCYAHELSAYVILCVDCNEFYTLGSEVADYIEIIGNVFDGYEYETEEQDEQPLQEAEKQA